MVIIQTSPLKLEIICEVAFSLSSCGLVYICIAIVEKTTPQSDVFKLT